VASFTLWRYCLLAVEWGKGVDMQKVLTIKENYSPSLFPGDVEEIRVKLRKGSG
jgi:hypothetical protein